MSSLLPGNIVYAGPANLTEIHKYRSLGHFILEKLKEHKNKTLLIDATTEQEYTGQMMYDAVVRMAYVLQSLGVKSGDVVGIASENSYEFVVVLHATFVLNATVAPLNMTYSESEVHHAINLSKPKIMFASKQTIERVVKVAKNNSFVKHVVLLNAISSNSKVHSFKELMYSPSIASQTEFFAPASNRLEDVAIILCSSGTTGLPKGVQLTEENILVAVDPGQIQLKSAIVQSSMLIVIPWFHVYGCLTLIAATVAGSKLVYLPRFKDDTFLKAIEKYKILIAFTVPPLMVFLAKNPKIEKYDLSSLKILLCGSAPLSKETEEQVLKRLNVLIMQGYGLSETTRGVLVQNDRYCKPGSVGEVKKGVYAKVVDPDTGKALGPNEHGELCFKGSYIMKGYIGDVTSTHAAIRDGWLHTGDIGYYDDDFEFFVVDRIKELIKYKGFQVPPAELEALLLTNTKVKEAAVIGKPDEEAGELPLAFIVKQENAKLTEEEVIQFVAERTSPAKRLRGGVIFVDDIPKNESGKILRRVLRDMLKKKIKSKL